MNEDQKLTPKYWIGHCLHDTDVYLETASKSKNEAEGEMVKLFYTGWEGDEDLTVSLFEIKPV